MAPTVADVDEAYARRITLAVWQGTLLQHSERVRHGDELRVLRPSFEIEQRVATILAEFREGVLGVAE